MSKDGKEKQQIIETSKIIWENNLYEQYYNPETKETGYVGLTTNKQEINKIPDFEFGDYLDKNSIIKYIPIKDELLEKNAVILPTEPMEYNNDNELEEDIDIFIKTWLDISEEHRQKATWYVMLSWVIDKLNTIPYLRCLGDYGTGKTRYLDVIGGICYKPMFVGGSVRSAPIYRTIDFWKGTAVFDEFNLFKSSESEDIIQILNNGFQRGKPVLRCDSTNYEKVNAFDPFGSKIIATRKPFNDNALESRCITEIMKMTTREDIPSDFTKEYYKTRNELQNKLLMYRLRNWDKIDPDETIHINFGGIQPRIKQSFQPFTILFQYDKDKLEQFKKYVQKYNDNIVEENSQTLDGMIINHYLKMKENYMPNITSQDIRNEIVNNGWASDKLDTRTIGKHLKSLGFETKPRFIDGKTIREVTINEETFKVLKTRYTIKNEENEGKQETLTLH